MGAPTTYNLSSIYTALGIKDKRVIPHIAGGELVPVIVLGNIETFAPSVIEARGVMGITEVTPAGRWSALMFLSVAPGGTIVEKIAHAELFGNNGFFYQVNLAPQRPFTGALGVGALLSTGGRPVQNICETAFNVLLPAPRGETLGGGRANLSYTTLNGIADAIWVPPGWFFWITFENFSAGGQTYQMAFRFKELPEAQGPP